MLERRAGEDNFKRILERAVFAACHPKAAGLPVEATGLLGIIRPPT